MRLQVAHHYPAQEIFVSMGSFGAQFVSGIIMPIDAGWGSRQACVISSALGEHGGHVLADRNSAVARSPGALADDEMINIVESHGGTLSVGWWSRVGACSLGWVSARKQDGLLAAPTESPWTLCCLGNTSH